VLDLGVGRHDPAHLLGLDLIDLRDADVAGAIASLLTLEFVIARPNWTRSAAFDG
jgi:hypothetical protein